MDSSNGLLGCTLNVFSPVVNSSNELQWTTYPPKGILLLRTRGLVAIRHHGGLPIWKGHFDKLAAGALRPYQRQRPLAEWTCAEMDF